ncbi:50S ribosomal protein L21e [Candidatus Pacearchaeota archaeon]|nr:50S ribosomal protein L21e [Candidatus Pacearchaeota archaeon]
MNKRKQEREKGKIRLSIYFQELGEGDRVAIVREHSIITGFPKRMQGKTGVVESRRGKAYIVKIKDNKQEKRYIIPAIHLKKIK